MKLINQKNPVMASWIREQGYRLDAPPFVSGALEARKTLEAIDARKDLLPTLTVGHNGGIYNGPQFTRNYVNNAVYGVPFLSSGSMLLADLSALPFLRNADAYSKKLSYLRLEPGMTLISCSGTVGRTVYCRPEMEDVWSSQDVLKVVPDPTKIPPGYLFAFLSSKFGLSMVASGTYGSIIQHLEPYHLSNLPVPRFGKKLEQEVHDLVQEAATKRSVAATTIRDMASRFDESISAVDLKQPTPRISVVHSRDIQQRMEAGYHDPIAEKIRKLIGVVKHTRVADLCTRIFLPGIFKRIHIDDERYGAPYYTGASLYWLEPKPKGILSRKTSLFDDVLLIEGTILVQAFGQEGGLTGRPVWVGRYLDGTTSTHMLARLFPADQSDAGYLFAFLSSQAGYQQVRCLPFGGSIPHFNEEGIGNVIIPLFEESVHRHINESVLAALGARDDALEMERAARKIVEEAIEGAV